MNGFEACVLRMTFILLAILGSQPVGAQVLPLDTEITVLGVTTGGASTSLAADQLAFLEQNFPSSNGITVSLANGGAPVTLTSNVLTGTREAQLSMETGV